eukprot:scaffold79429_cov37-Tisochrysis_lutea.AAC.1
MKPLGKENAYILYILLRTTVRVLLGDGREDVLISARHIYGKVQSAGEGFTPFRYTPFRYQCDPLPVFSWTLSNFPPERAS